MGYELFTYYRSSAAYRVRIALNYKEIDHKLTAINLLSAEHDDPAYKAINPQGLVPALKIPDGRIITQSPAILNFLENEHPTPPLMPADTYETATINQWCSVVACDIHPVNNLRILKYLTGKLGISEQAKMEWYHHWVLQGFECLEQQIKAAPYCNGNALSTADLYLIPQVFNALRFDVKMERFPKIMSVYEACNSLDAFIAAAPDKQKG
ncbi:maleylacetoacetate isomerase [Sneathiella glossodoripedis]|uniref:maleylacetoacetate isomerase n=1 Tax=Sneathiella glossodoripedis TaxID=418853 RepID=UPI0004701882|nr:maleylacetoacetate isomerase [Sneathiella glossodoripedis]